MDSDSTDANQAWKFSQCFGDKGDIENITEADVISAVEFDHTGNYLATGDKGGRVVLFERNESKKGCEYRFHTEFQSHDAEFDYLKSLEIEEKINQIEWCRRQNQAHFLLSTNDKTIKLWKVFGKSLKVVAENNLSDGTGAQPRSLVNMDSLRLPRMTLHDTIIAATPRRIYANAHTYHINAISVNSDNETYISADDLRINLWNLGISDQSFNIVDIKPANMEELSEVITSAKFHPISCNLFMYSTSKGTIKLADMRESALCDSHAKVYEQRLDSAEQTFFTEITSSIAKMDFSHDGRYIVARDYMTVKIWDVNMDREPIKTINVHEHIYDKLCDAYENDAIFDKFEVAFSGDSKSVITGSYNNSIMIYPNAVDPKTEETQVLLHADKSAFKAKKVGVPTAIGGGSLKNGSRINRSGINMMKRDVEHEPVDFKKNILHLSWHPRENSIAVAATNNLFVFSTL